MSAKFGMYRKCQNMPGNAARKDSVSQMNFLTGTTLNVLLTRCLEAMWLCQEVSHWKIRWRNEAVDILSEISQQHEHFFIIASLMFHLLDKSFASFFNWEISKKEKFYKECFLLPWWFGKCSELYISIKLCINIK